VTERINALLAKYEQIKNDDMTAELVAVEKMVNMFSTEQLAHAVSLTDVQKVQDFEDERDLSQYICHIDMDAFYASVEELDQPHLKDVPMV
jgi:DNA polymerase kappa